MRNLQGHDRESEFRDFMAGCQARMLRVAELLTRDHGQAEDLAQHGFAMAFARWGKIRDTNPEAYVRKCIGNAYIDRWRRGSWREQSTSLFEDRVGVNEAELSIERAHVLTALSRLTLRERTVVVLRFYCDLSEQDIADELRIKKGTVKSATARALTKLRNDSELHERCLDGR